ncbi:MAG: PKD domain-containing protein [Bacteroidia bacterium]
MKRKNLLLAFLTAFSFGFLGLRQDVRASHAMGADLTYECLGGNQYRLRFSFYRDCAGIPAPASILTEYYSTCFPGPFNVTLNPVSPIPNQISPVCPTATSTCNGGTFTGIEEWIYEATVTLPGPCADWIFTHSECCRNSAITTIANPGSENLVVYSQLDNTNGLCNNSPTFSNNPVPFACVGQRFCFNHGAFDVDGDSLSYQLINPLTSISLGGASTTVSYNGGYSSTQPVISTPPAPPASFNTSTGDFCITPTQQDVTVFAVLVNEYRNGVLIGQVERDIQLTVLNCNNFLPTLTGINGTPSFSRNLCADQPFSFYIASIDADAPNTTTITWDFGIPGATLTMTGGQRDSAFFSWTPTQADIGGPYCFTATVADDNCPYIGTQIYSYCFTVRGVEADAGPDQAISCGATANLSGSASGGSGIYSYAWNPGNIPGQNLNGVGIGQYVLTVNDGQCTNTDTVNITPGSGVPVANFSFTNNCSGAPIQFTDQTAVGSGTISTWSWNFGDGNTSAQQNPQHQYAANGTYQVTLIVQTPTGCSDTIQQQITVNTNIPTAQFTSASVCQGAPMSFTDQSLGTPNAWSWNFGDPASGSNTSASQNPSHTFSGSGNYTVTLTVTNAAGCTSTVQSNVTVNANPTITVNNAQICEGQQAVISGPAGFSSYSWNTGSTQSSITVSPTVTTTYTLTVTDGNGCTASDPATLTVNPLPVANAGNPQTICEGQQATLNGGGGASYEWNPGALAGQSVNVTPTSTSTYTVTVTSGAGCTSTASVTINVNQMPSVNAGDDLAICKGGSITITAVSPIGSFTWQPGNLNGSSITVSPTVTTDYTVQVSDAIGCSGSDIVRVTVNPLPVAAFSSTAPACRNSTIDFTDASQIPSGSVTAWSWTFDNGQTSAAQDPNSTYPLDGNYQVQLIVASDAGCRDTVVNAITIHPLPTAVAGLDQDICPGFNATLTGSGGAAYEWSPGGLLGASIVVSPAATTDYQVLVTDANGCTGTDIVRVNVRPVPVANAGTDQSICFGESATLYATGGDTYLWLNSGGVTTQNWNVAPQGTRTYDVIVTNSFGCKDTDQVEVRVNPLPVAAFGNTAPVCQFNSISFDDQSSVASGNVSAWAWDFGNGVNSSNQNAQVPYQTAGDFPVTLIITTDAGCRDTVSQTVRVNAKPVAGFNHSDVCAGVPILFESTSSISDATPLSLSWNLGDNTASANPSFNHLYASYGSYPVTLLVTSTAGCTDSIRRVANVFALPDAAFTVPYVCEDEAVAFTDGSTIPDGFVSDWYWTLGDGSVAAESNPTHTYQEQGNYPIHLLITSNHGCQDSTDGLIRVIPRPLADFSTQNVCLGFETNLTSLAQPSTGPITSYLWDFGDGTSSEEENPVHIYSNPGWYTVSLTVRSDSGCATTMIRPNALNIFAPPVADFSTNSSQASDIYPMVNFTNQTSSPGFFFWDFGDSTTSTDYSPLHIYPEIGIYDIRLVAIDYNGCVDTTYQRIELRPSSTLFVPNTFTPNGDLKNDVFKAYSYNVIRLEGAIYDRWGLKIFEWNTLEGGWDGKVNGSPAQADTYVYRIAVIDVNDKRDVVIGHVNLVR